ncbi:TPA: hypothetical protein U8184_000310 [Pseudomonas aeruginosa]|nr:hypothetical protein [Pseudomonas aeruginosa]HEN8544767.1 hypothetical protein [Pseudomonas aeruginosa]
MSMEMNKALDLLREIRPSIPKEVLELWCKDRDAFLASHPAVEQADASSCQGTNCGTTTGDHSSECLAEAAASQGWELKPGDLCGRDCPVHPASGEQAGGERWDALQSIMEWTAAENIPDDRKLCLIRNAARASLEQPSPAQARSTWPKLEKPAQVGAVRFSAGVSSRLVVEAAQRLYEFESTPEKEAERIERLQAFREQCFEPLGTEFSKVLSDNLPDLLSTAQAEQAEAERPEVASLTADLYEIAERILEIAEGRPKAISTTLMAPVRDYRLKDAKAVARVMGERLVALADRYVHHDRVVGALRFERQQMDRAFTACINERDAANARLHEVATACATAEQGRDAALARVAELEAKLSDPTAVHQWQFSNAWFDGSEEVVLKAGKEGSPIRTLYAAPVAQAQRSVPEEFSFEYRHPNGECHTVTVSREQVINEMPDFLFEALCSKFCNCEPVGETNVVECRCDEYAEEFKLIAAAPGKEGV